MNIKFAYLAGYIDGDGCFRVNKYTSKEGVEIFERSITITSVCKTVIEYFLQNFGGTFFHQTNKENRRDTFIWTVKNDEALIIAEQIFPFLVIKKNQCKNFISYCYLIQRNNFKKVSSDIINKRIECIDIAKKDIHEFDQITKENISLIKQESVAEIASIIDCSYFAGFCDAEACFRISKRLRKATNNFIYNTVLEIGNTKYSIFPWIYARFKGNFTFVKSNSPTRKNSCTWSLHAKSLFPIITMIHPFLIVKKEVCEEIIKFQKTILKNGGKRTSVAFKEQYKLICQDREMIIQNVHILNKKGK